MGKFGSLSSSSSSDSDAESTSDSEDVGRDGGSSSNNKPNRPSKQQQWVSAGPNKAITSGTTGREWKTIEMPTYASPRRQRKPSAGAAANENAEDEEGSERQPSEASTDVSSSSSSSAAAAAAAAASSGSSGTPPEETAAKPPPRSDGEEAQSGGDAASRSSDESDSEESETNSRIMRQVMHGSSHEESNVDDDDDDDDDDDQEEEEESETESMRMRRILYGSTTTNTNSNDNDNEGSEQIHDNYNASLSSIGGPGTGTARRAVVPDTVQEMDEERTDDGDLLAAPLQQSTSHSQSFSGSGSVSRSYTASSKSGSSYHSPSQSRSSYRSGGVSHESSKTPPASPQNSQSGSTTPSSQRSGSVASKHLSSRSSRSSAATPLSQQLSTSQRSGSFASHSQRSNSASTASNRSHHWDSNHTGTNSVSRSISTRSDSQTTPRGKEEEEAASESSQKRWEGGSRENESATEGSKSKQSSPDPPESVGSPRNGREGKQPTPGDQEEPGLGNECQVDLNGSIRSRESILQRLRERRKTKEAEDEEAEQPPEEVPQPPLGKELARDPSGDLKSFTGEYETRSENEEDDSGERFSGENISKGGNEDIENEKDKIKQQRQEEERRIGEFRPAVPREIDAADSSEKSQKDTTSDQRNNDEGTDRDDEAEIAKIESKHEPVKCTKEAERVWSPVKEKKNTPLTLHKLGSHDTDDWKPPALTTYGEQKYIPATRRQDEGRRDPDAEDPAGGLKQERAPSPNPKLQSQNLPLPKLPQRPVDRGPVVHEEEMNKKVDTSKENKKGRPPVSPPPEITLISSLDDDSSLGTYGTYLERFPPKEKKKKEASKPPKPAVVPRFAQEDSIAHGHEVKKKTAVVPRFAQEDTIAGGHEVKKVVPRFAQGDSVAGGHEVKKKGEGETAKAPAMTPRFAQDDSVAGAHEVKKKEGTITDSEGSIPRFVGGDALVQETMWGDKHLIPPPRPNEAQDDYYRSWIHAHSRGNDNPDRQDPPEDVNLFPFNPRNGKVDREEEQESDSIEPTPFNSGVNREALNSSTWVPKEKKPEVRRTDSIPSLPLYCYKSERSTNSVWGAPGLSKGRNQDDVDLEARRMYIDSIMAKNRPTSIGRDRTAQSRSAFSAGRSARVDNTGAIRPSSPSKSSASPASSYVSGTSRSATSRSGDQSSCEDQSPSSSRSRTSRSSNSTGISRQSTGAKRQRVTFPSTLLGTATESVTSRSIEVVDESSRTVSRPPKTTAKYDDWSESSHDIEVVDQTSRTASRPADGTLHTVSVDRPEQPIPQNSSTTAQHQMVAKRTAPFSSSRAMIAIVVAIFFILAGVGVVIYFFVVPLFQEQADSPTPAPTPTPSIDTSLQGLRSLISDTSPETGASFNDPDSPQSLALDWLSKNQFLGSYTREQVLQRFAMVTLYYSAGGESWKRSDLWLSNIDECEWYSSESQTDVCNRNGQLDEIDLIQNGLSGSLPWNELAILQSHLLALDVYANQVSGSLESTVGKLTSLVVLELQRNGFVGTIPSEVGQLRSMKHLVLAGNDFSGTIPTELVGMTDLESLNLSDNSLEGSIPDELGSMSALRNVFLNGNNLIGTIPSELCAQNLDNLVVDCSAVVCDCCTCGSDTENPPVDSPSPADSPSPVEDPISGPTSPPVPVSGPALSPAPTPSDPSQPVGTPTSGNDLESLIISVFPDGREALQDPDSPQSQALQWLQSAANDGISTEEGYLQRYALATFYYSTNGDGWNDKTAWLSNTNECSWISTANSLDICDNFGRYLSIDLQENNLQGEVPPEIAILSDSLKTINLRANQISGEIPVSLQNFGELETVDLSSNSFEGLIPQELFDATNLRQLSLFENNLISTLPLQVGQLTRLELLDVGANQLTGTLPSTLGQLTRLAGLSVFDNSFTGTLPRELSNAKSLQLLYVDSNDLRGPLPTDVCLLNLEEFWSDCEEVQCVCCTTCCSDSFGCFET